MVDLSPAAFPDVVELPGKPVGDCCTQSRRLVRIFEAVIEEQGHEIFGSLLRRCRRHSRSPIRSWNAVRTFTAGSVAGGCGTGRPCACRIWPASARTDNQSVPAS